jgi:uncharacterized protein (TIGR00369 family)
VPPVPEDVEMGFPLDGGCFGCSPSNPHGLGLRFRRRGEEVHAHYVVADRFHGAPGVVHGGIVAAILDEISCAAVVFVDDRFVVTGELCVRYERPVPVDTQLRIDARIVDRSHPRYYIIEAAIHDDHHRLARSSGKFFLRNQPPGAMP